MAKKKWGNDGDDQFHEGSEFAPEELTPSDAVPSDGYKQTGWKGFEEEEEDEDPALVFGGRREPCLLYTSPSPRDQRGSRMPSSA